MGTAQPPGRAAGECHPESRVHRCGGPAVRNGARIVTGPGRLPDCEARGPVHRDGSGPSDVAGVRCSCVGWPWCAAASISRRRACSCGAGAPGPGVFAGEMRTRRVRTWHRAPRRAQRAVGDCGRGRSSSRPAIAATSWMVAALSVQAEFLRRPAAHRAGDDPDRRVVRPAARPGYGTALVLRLSVSAAIAWPPAEIRGMIDIAHHPHPASSAR